MKLVLLFGLLALAAAAPKADPKCKGRDENDTSKPIWCACNTKSEKIDTQQKCEDGSPTTHDFGKEKNAPRSSFCKWDGAAKGEFKCVPKTTSGDSLVKQMVDNIDKGGMGNDKGKKLATELGTNVGGDKAAATGGKFTKVAYTNKVLTCASKEGSGKGKVSQPDCEKACAAKTGCNGFVQYVAPAKMGGPETTCFICTGNDLRATTINKGDAGHVDKQLYVKAGCKATDAKIECSSSAAAPAAPAAKGGGLVEKMAKNIDAGKIGGAENKKLAAELGTNVADEAPAAPAAKPKGTKVEQMAKNIDAGKIGGEENKKLAGELGTAEKACKKTKKAPGGKCNKVTGDASTCGDYHETKPVSAVAKKLDKNAKGDTVVCIPRTGGKVSSPCVEGHVPPPKC